MAASIVILPTATGSKQQQAETALALCKQLNQGGARYSVIYRGKGKARNGGTA